MSDYDYVFYLIFKYFANITFNEHGGSLRFLVSLPSNKTDSPSLFCLCILNFFNVKSAFIPSLLLNCSSIHYNIIHVKCLMS